MVGVSMVQKSDLGEVNRNTPGELNRDKSLPRVLKSMCLCKITSKLQAWS